MSWYDVSVFKILLNKISFSKVSTSCVQGKLRKERGGTLLQVLHRFKTGGIGDEYERYVNAVSTILMLYR